MAYQNIRDKEAFNVHLEHAKTTLLLLSDYLRFRQDEDFDNMYNCLENIVNFNSAKINTAEIDNKMEWINRNKNRWCVKDKETGQIRKVNIRSKYEIIKNFQDTFRTIIRELHDKGITHKHSDDPANAMARFES